MSSARRRAEALREMRRVTRASGRLILSTPHAGWFAWLDANNVRFRVPRLHALFIGSGLKDAPYEEKGLAIVEHQHFRAEDLIDLAAGSWRARSVIYGGLLIAPAVDWLRWPFYRTGRSAHPISLRLEALAAWDVARSYGRASSRVMIVFDAA